MRAGFSIMARQLKRSVPSGAQLPQRWRWSRMSICGHLPPAQLGPPAFNNVRQPLGSPVPIPSDDRTANRLVPFAVAQGLRHCDPEAPVVETDLRRPHVCGIDDHADVAPQVRQGLAADEVLGRSFQHLPRRMVEDPGRPLANYGSQLAVRRRHGCGNLHTSAVRRDLDRLLAPLASTDLVVDGRVAEADAVPFGHW